MQSRIILFGRNDNRTESLFENLLTITNIAKVKDGEQNLIKLIWNKLSLKHVPEILSNVSKLTAATSLKYLTFFVSEKSSWTDYIRLYRRVRGSLYFIQYDTMLPIL